MFLSNRGASHDSNYGVALLISPITTAIAVGLSFYLGVPMIGLAALTGWGLALALTGLGYGLSQLGQHIKEDTRLSRDVFLLPPHMRPPPQVLRSGSATPHTEPRVESNHFTIEHFIFNDMTGKCCKLCRFTEAMRIRNA